MLHETPATAGCSPTPASRGPASASRSFNASPSATHWVDVTDTIDAGIASLREHQTYLDVLAEPTDPDAFLRGTATAAGEPLGVAAAVTFELVGL